MAAIRPCNTRGVTGIHWWRWAGTHRDAVPAPRRCPKRRPGRVRRAAIHRLPGSAVMRGAPAPGKIRARIPRSHPPLRPTSS
ncbi:hypothetical protein NDU88_002434 [Pleurodeles waltl]|uniref:Uncharacterized protein n=1 Tax=Pleurodeles waltl TaxID=8319 RepID=A0AAV7UVQ7_PLEWA|nr:hypothetical protein NDU88_002434 [Pleurodeles waltl]